MEDWTAEAEDLELDELPIVLRALVGGGTAPTGVGPPRLRKPGNFIYILNYIFKVKKIIYLCMIPKTLYIFTTLS